MYGLNASNTLDPSVYTGSKIPLHAYASLGICLYFISIL